MSTTAIAAHQGYDTFDAFVTRINARFNALTGPIFRTDATGLYEAYLAAFAEGAERQYHTCSCCRSFIEHFGALATVDAAGQLVPIWDADDAPTHYRPAVDAMARLVRRASITMPFLSSQPTYGNFYSGRSADGALWGHFAITPPVSRVFHTNGLKDAHQMACEKREELGSVITALGEYSAATCATALQLLKDDHLGNSAAVLGQAQFLVDLHAIGERAKGKPAQNLVWRAVAEAPSGFCHPRSSMIATLLDDIQAGMSFEDAKRRWNAKMHPLQYQRPQAAPTAGNIAQAEKLFEQLGLAPALKRRIARLDEVPMIWQPPSLSQPAALDGVGVFGHLKAKEMPASQGMAAPSITITLEKFARTVAPAAEKIQVQLANPDGFIAITTAVDHDAPKLFQWDHTFAWYVRPGGSSPAQYGLSTGWATVAGITRLPARWNDEGKQKFAHHGDGIILLLQGARETRSAGAALFPVFLRGDLREVRATIESYSNRAEMVGLSEGSAIGIDLRQGGNSSFPTTVRVTAGGRTQLYKIDRWD